MPQTLKERMAAKQKAAKTPAPAPKPEPKDGDLPPLREAVDKIDEAEAEAIREVVAETPPPERAPGPVYDGAAPVRQGLKGQFWFKAIRDGSAKVEEAIPYYEAVVNDAHQHLAFKGPLNDLLTEHPGLAYFYRSILTDAQQVRRYLEMKAEQTEAEKYKWLMTSEEAKQEYGTLKTTEAGKFAKADEDVLKLQDQVRIMANIEHHLDNVALGFQDRGIMLSHIRAVREAGHHEVFIDSRIESDVR